MSVVTSIVDIMIIDCDTCSMREIACGDCVVTILIGPPPNSNLEAEEARVIDLLASRGMIPPLRYENVQDSQEVTRRSG
jgi:hypothetical protein